MRDTRKTLLISGGLVLGGSAMVATGAALLETQGETLLTGVLIFIGLAIAPISAFLFVSSAVSGARKEAVERGVDEIARWKLTPPEWAAFRDQEARMTAAGRPQNIFTVVRQIGDGEVIFARRAVIADGDYHDLTPGGLVDLSGVEFVQGAPSCLEFAMRAAKGRGAGGIGIGFNYLWLRIPIAAGETREAMRVLQHYKQTTRRGVAIAMRRPSLTIGLCLGVAAACALAAVWGFANASSDVYGEAPLVAAVVGVILGLGALLLAAIVFYRVRVLKG